MEPTPANLARTAIGCVVVLLVTYLGTYYFGARVTLLEASGGQAQPELLFLAHPSVIDGYLRALGDTGRQLYARAQYTDLLNAAAVILTGIFVIRWLAVHLPADTRWPRLLMSLPLATGLADIAENVLLLRALKGYPGLSPMILPWITSLKLALGFATLLAIAGLAAIALRLRRLAPVQL